MFIKLFHFLSLFAYLNLIVYEPETNTSFKEDTFASDSLLEIVLDDLLEIPMHNYEDDIEVPNENYRVFQTGIYIVPAILLLLSFFLFKQIGKLIAIVHPFYKTKSTCLPSYYTHLFRFKPF